MAQSLWHDLQRSCDNEFHLKPRLAFVHRRGGATTPYNQSVPEPQYLSHGTAPVSSVVDHYRVDGDADALDGEVKLGLPSKPGAEVATRFALSLDHTRWLCHTAR